MVLGDDSALPDELRDAFRAASLTHLVRVARLGRRRCGA
jgi:predicted membrane metal-binding protein